MSEYVWVFFLAMLRRLLFLFLSDLFLAFLCWVFFLGGLFLAFLRWLFLGSLFLGLFLCFLFSLLLGLFLCFLFLGLFLFLLGFLFLDGLFLFLFGFGWWLTKLDPFGFVEFKALTILEKSSSGN